MDWIRAPRTYSELSGHRKSSSGQVCFRAAKPWRNATEWSGAQALSSKPPAASARIFIIRFSGSIASRRPGMRQIGIGSGSLVSKAVSLAGIELSQRGADAGLGPPASLAIPPSYPNSGIFPLTGCPDRRNGTSAEQSQDEIWLQVEDIGGLKLAVAAGT